jgi:putative transcriptional regulator
MNAIALSPLADIQTRYEAAMFDYAAGSLPTGLAFVVAAHLAVRPPARALVSVFDSAGGALLDALDPVGIAQPDWLADENAAPSKTLQEPRDVAHVLASLDQGRWRRNVAGMLVKPVPGVAAQLLKLEAGRSVPHHGHHGLELTLVLSGTFGDGHGVYQRGDLVVHDEDSEHQPHAMATSDCICLISQTAPVRLKGAVGWFVKHFSA